MATSEVTFFRRNFSRIANTLEAEAIILVNGKAECLFAIDKTEKETFSLKRVFNHIFKHQDVHQKYSAAIIFSNLFLLCGIDHFTVVSLVTWPLNDSKAGVDLVLIQTSLLLLCK